MLHRPILFIIATIVIWGGIIGFSFLGSELYNTRVPNCQNTYANVTQFFIGNYTPPASVHWINITYTYSVNDSTYFHHEWMGMVNKQYIAIYKDIYGGVGNNLSIGYTPSTPSFSWRGGCATYWGYTVLIAFFSVMAFLSWVGLLVWCIQRKRKDFERM